MKNLRKELDFVFEKYVKIYSTYESIFNEHGKSELDSKKLEEDNARYLDEIIEIANRYLSEYEKDDVKEILRLYSLKFQYCNKVFLKIQNNKIIEKVKSSH
jgi:hypothetical protein